jgi:hypothetical protein
LREGVLVVDHDVLTVNVQSPLQVSVLTAHHKGESVWNVGFRRRDADGCDRDGRAPRKLPRIGLS